VFLITVDTASSDIAKKAHKSQTSIEYERRLQRVFVNVLCVPFCGILR